MSDDRPKRSWREIDAARSGTGQRQRRDPDAAARAKTESSPAYSKYKSELDKLFTPGGRELPAELKAKLGPPNPEAQAKSALAAELKNQPSADTLARFLAAGLSLPEDPRFLTNLLDIPAGLNLVPVIKALGSLVAAGKKKPNRMLLLGKLDALIDREGRGPVVDLARDLRRDVE